MTSNLLIGFPDISTYMIDGNITSDPYPNDNPSRINNLFGGSKTDIFKIDSSQTGDCRFKWDGNSRPISFLAIGNLKLLKLSGVTNFSLRGKNSDDYATATVIKSEASLSSVTLYGPEVQDYIATFSAATYTYLYLNFNSPSVATVYPVAKIYMGTLFDFGRDPVFPSEMTKTRPSAFQRRPLHEFTLRWEEITKEKTYEAIYWMASRRDFQPVFLYTTTYHYALNNLRLLYARVAEFSYRPRKSNTFDITIKFEEVI